MKVKHQQLKSERTMSLSLSLIDGAGQTLLLFLLGEATHPAWPLYCLVRRLGANGCSGEGDVSDGECRPDEVGGGRGGGQA